MELISIIVPVYNREDIFKQSFESIIRQTYPRLQIIVIDDGSLGDIKSVYDSVQASHSDPQRSFLYIRQENKGAPAARNEGLKYATGEYVIFWDADVVGESYMLQVMYDALDMNHDTSFAYSNFLFGRKLFRGIPFSFEKLKEKNYITTTSLIRRKDVVCWDESLKRFQDWDLWLTLSQQQKKGVWIDQTLFRVETGGTISSWLPRIAYTAAFRWLPFVHRRVSDYEKSERVIRQKHAL